MSEICILFENIFSLFRVFVSTFFYSIFYDYEIENCKKLYQINYIKFYF